MLAKVSDLVGGAPKDNVVIADDNSSGQRAHR
jgi:hypothetical protein